MRTAPSDTRRLTVALAGNPNSGKTSVFNNITGARQHVGNYPGVTVEKKEGSRRFREYDLTIVDLPGTYSLTSYSIEEVVARNFIMHERPDVVVHVVDASNIERNLYLATQFIELDVPLVIGLNMFDVARDRGIEFDLPKLSELLGARVVPMIARVGEGTDDLLEAIVEMAAQTTDGMPTRSRALGLSYGKDVDDELDRLEPIIAEQGESHSHNARWLALKLLENDSDVRGSVHSEAVHAAVAKSMARLEGIFGDTPEIVIADRRYGFVSGACQEAVRNTVEARHSLSDQVDTVLANRALGLPIFFGLMYLVFQLTFTLGEPPMAGLEALFEWAGDTLRSYWPTGQDSLLLSLLADGIIGGVGGVVVFLPNILLLFLGIAFLEDTGYMARAAFIMDRLMHRIGLHGKSFIPMLIGFGCSVPAIMATRTLDNQRDRLTTMLVIPLMSCGARLPIYALIIPAFFPKALNAPMLMLIYLIGILLAILAAKALRATLFRGESTPLVMELPPYRMPTLRAVAMHMWERAWLYVRKAGTVILGVSIVLWALSAFPRKDVTDTDYAAAAERAHESYAAAVQGMSPALGLPEGSTDLLRALGRDGVQQDLPEGVAAFLGVRDRILQADEAFADAVEQNEVEEGTPRYLALAHQHATSLEEIEEQAPEVYPLAVRYLREIRAGYEETLKRLARSERLERLQYSIAGRIGKAMEPALRPMGFDWRIGTALIGAFAAKEVFVAQLGIVYTADADTGTPDTLRQRLRANYTPLTAFCIMLFALISTPCVATIATTRRESNSWGWALFQLFGLTALAWVLTTAVYQVGALLGIGT